MTETKFLQFFSKQQEISYCSQQENFSHGIITLGKTRQFTFVGGRQKNEGTDENKDRGIGQKDGFLQKMINKQSIKLENKRKKKGQQT